MHIALDMETNATHLRRKLFLLMLFHCLSIVLIGQTTFKKIFGTSGNDTPFFVEVLPDNSFLVAGGTTGGGLGGTDAMLVKFADDGTVEWAKAFGGGNYDLFTHIHSCSDGNFIAIGNRSGTGSGNDVYVVKVDGGGNLLWERTIGGLYDDGARGICEVSDGYIITGSTMSFGGGAIDILVEKLDLSGNSVWSKAFGSSGNDIGGEPIPAANGEVWVSGHLPGAGNNDGVLLRIGATGTLISATRVNGGNEEFMNYLSAGGTGLTSSGSTNSYSGSNQQPFMAGFNTAGNLVWGKRYLMPAGNYEIQAEDCPDGGFIFSPYSISGNFSDAYLIKTDATGNITWAKSYAMPGGGRMFHAGPAPDGGYVAVGHCTGAGQDIFIVKTDAIGNIAGCCPEDAPITAAAITPSTPGASPGEDTGDPAAVASTANQAMVLTETNLCDGSECCSTEAGTMLAQSLHFCINEPATFTHNDDEVLDGNDLLQFILFSNPNDTLGSILAISNTPTFTFNPATMQTETTYYVAAIAGNNLGGNVDLDDPCLDISNAAQLIWHPLPEVLLQVDNTDVCAGDCYTVTAVLTGTPPFTLTVNSPAGATTVSFQGLTGTFPICLPPNTPPGTFTVQATMLMDAYCTCQ
ncbi:MAG: hypothetical protein SFV52_13915 [Saprospiraceae bacterium]|nr:hypothetical protein [Saprospiraceae bacterium]